MKYPLIQQLMEGRLISRDLRILQEVFEKSFRGRIMDFSAEEHKSGRFRGTIEGEGYIVGPTPTSSEIKKAEAALEEVAFEEFVRPGTTVMGADVELGSPSDRNPHTLSPSVTRGKITRGALPFTFVIELDQD